MERVEKIIKKYIDVDYDIGDRVKVKDVNILKDVNKNEWEWGHFNEKDMEAIKNANEIIVVGVGFGEYEDSIDVVEIRIDGNESMILYPVGCFEKY